MLHAIGDAVFHTVSFGRGQRCFLGFGAWVFGWELWEGPIELLSESWRATAFDQRGSGETICPPESISMSAMVDDVFSVMDALEIERCVLGAESRGMIVAVKAVVAHPERFDGLVVVAGQPSFSQPSAHAEAFLRRVHDDLPSVLDDMMARFFPDPADAHLRWWGRHIGQRSSLDVAIAAQAAMLGADVGPELGKVATPTLLLHGSSDTVVPLHVAQSNAAAISGSKLVVFDGVGHGPSLARPVQVAQAIDEYFGGSSV